MCTAEGCAEFAQYLGETNGQVGNIHLLQAAFYAMKLEVQRRGAVANS